MRIALVTTSFFPTVGGGEYVVHNLANTWQRNGHTVCVFNAITKNITNTEAKYSIEKYNVPLVCLKYGFLQHRFPFCNYVSQNLKTKLNIFNPDVISAHFGYPLAIWLSKINPLPKFLITCHGGEITKFPWGWRERYKIEVPLTKALNKASGVVAISHQARILIEEMGVEPKKIIDIPNGVDLERFRRRIDSNIRRQLKIQDDQILILSVGREHPQKAYDIGLRAFSKVAKAYKDAVYLIVGGGTDKWRGLIDDLGLGSRVVLCQKLEGDELVSAYSGADIFFSPSRWELMPLVVLEAMASGLPLLVTDVSGSQDLVDDGENGFLVTPEQPDMIAEKLATLIENKTLRRTFGEENIKRSERNSWDVIADLYLKEMSG